MEKRLPRWYVTCCNTPIANTTRHWKFPDVGLLHTGLKADAGAYEQAFPRLQMRVNTGSAKEAPPGLAFGTLVALMGFMPRVLASAVNGSYTQTPFFNAPAGSPTVDVLVLSKTGGHALGGRL